ncbi:filamentous hemagglutinin N-terminal domain-containing protein [Dulcicalothrix desertica]|nr:filamentous hemagglutinin N-terminal domain-containing protein [Dulcicalothrix desertica]
MNNIFSSGLRFLGIICCGVIALRENFAVAQVIPDTTLPNNSRVESINNSKIINGGTQVESNLFHSFEEFSIPIKNRVYFNNQLDIQNIISRVTGSKISNIDGLIKANGAANLFFINPNGIVFGNNAELNIGGSFIASTASSLNFADGSKFSATDTKFQQVLKVSVPEGLQFGTIANPIYLTSQASPDSKTNSLGYAVGLQVEPGKTLALVGGDIILSGGNLTAPGGRIELLSVGSDSNVSLHFSRKGWYAGHEGIQNFQDIQISERTKIPSFLDASGSGGGSIQLTGRNILINGDSSIFTTTLGSDEGGNLSVTATELVELISNGGKSLQVGTESMGNAPSLTITTKKLVIKDGAQVETYSNGLGSGGRLTINADYSVELWRGYSFKYISIDRDLFIPSAILSSAYTTGNAGEVIINTFLLSIHDGARVSTSSPGLYLATSNQYIPASGQGGNLTVNARDSIELAGGFYGKNNSTVSGLFTSTQGTGNAGNLELNTQRLIVRDRASVNVSSEVTNNSIYSSTDVNNIGSSGALKVQASSIILDNQGKLISESVSGRGGNINLQIHDLLLMRRGSQIPASAGKLETPGDGGNITIDVPTGFIVAPPQENNDITANAFSGSGGKVQINAISLFGTAPRSREDLVRKLKINNGTNPSVLDPDSLPTSDITAISQENPTLNGIVNINTLDDSINRTPINLSTKLVEQKLSQSCRTDVLINQSQFVITGRGGLPINPLEPIRSSTILEPDWVSVERGDSESRQDFLHYAPGKINIDSSRDPMKIVEAIGWVRSSKGDLYLVANTPFTKTNTPRFQSVSCRRD